MTETEVLSKLACSLDIGEMHCKNRIMRSAANDFLGNTDGSVSERQLEIYSQLSNGGAGLIITANFAVSPDGRNDNRLGLLCSGCDTNGLYDLSSAIKSGGAAAVVQLSHAGARSRIHRDESVYGGLTRIEQWQLTALATCFGESAELAMGCGFDGVQLHCAHGYLLSCFLDPAINHRQDAYGGNLLGRMRFPLMCLDEIKKRCGSFPVMLKVNATSENPAYNKQMLRELPEMLKIFKSHGAVFAEISGADFKSQPSMARNYYITSAGLIKGIMPFAIVGGTRCLGDMAVAFNAGASMISMCRPLIRQPELPNLMLSGETTDSECVGCNQCFTLPLEGWRRCAFHKL